MTHSLKTEHAQALEDMWAGRFGQAYTDRNPPAADAGTFHRGLCRRLGIRRVLEVGCNQGLNLTRLDADPDFTAVGVDICGYALAAARRRLVNVGLVQATIYNLPFADASFDFVFTCGVLIHVPPDGLGRAMEELHRVSGRYIWCGEYYSADRVEIPYRGQAGALFKDDFGGRYRAQFPDLRLLDRGNLEKATSGFDDLTWWLFEKA